MAEAQLQLFLEKVRQLNAFVARCQGAPALLQELRDCSHHDQVVALARREGFEIGRRWGEGEPDGSDQEAAAMLQIPIAAALSADGVRGLGDSPCPPSGAEHSEILLQSPVLRLERIHSCAAVTPAGRWYDQEEHEWVALLQGSARLRFSDEPEDRRLNQGDSLLIRAGRRHRVTATDPYPGTLWLALFWRDP